MPPSAVVFRAFRRPGGRAMELIQATLLSDGAGAACQGAAADRLPYPKQKRSEK